MLKLARYYCALFGLLLGCFQQPKEKNFNKWFWCLKYDNFAPAILAKKGQILGLTNFWEEEVEREREGPTTHKERMWAKVSNFYILDVVSDPSLLFYFIGVK